VSSRAENPAVSSRAEHPAGMRRRGTGVPVRAAPSSTAAPPSTLRRPLDSARTVGLNDACRKPRARSARDDNGDQAEAACAVAARPFHRVADSLVRHTMHSMASARAVLRCSLVIPSGASRSVIPSGASRNVIPSGASRNVIPSGASRRDAESRDRRNVAGRATMGQGCGHDHALDLRAPLRCGQHCGGPSTPRSASAPLGMTSESSSSNGFQ
jgi:hypothetical protein